jgi:8-amino-7-oxononanoate synthase
VTTDALRFLRSELEALEQSHRLRTRPRPATGSALNLCSNDYLGLIALGRLRAAGIRAAERTAAGAGASRLVFGEHEAHRRLEAAISAWLRTEETLVFSSGYACNLGLIPALARRGDRIVSDALNHASIVDGCRLARAEIIVVPHCDLAATRRALQSPGSGRSWLVTESYFSMDGDGPDLAALRAACDETGAALIVDEAHALGVFGPEGRGRCAEVGVVPDVLVGTLGKALGVQGAFVSGAGSLCRWLWGKARSFVFSTGISPWICDVAEAAVGLARAAYEERVTALANAQALREGLGRQGLTPAPSFGPILPIIVGDDLAALGWSERLAAHGVLVQAIRPPTVPEGGARLRVSANAALGPADIRHALEAFAAARAEGLR